jgi:hypothetical protein
MSSANYGLRIGLDNPHTANASLKQYVVDALDLSGLGVKIQMGSVSNHSHIASSQKGDVVLYRDVGVGLCAGQVLMHIEINEVPLTLLQHLDMQSNDRKRGIAIWKILDTRCIVETETIVDPMIWNRYDDGVIRTILPRDV